MKHVSSLHFAVAKIYYPEVELHEIISHKHFKLYLPQCHCVWMLLETMSFPAFSSDHCSYVLSFGRQTSLATRRGTKCSSSKRESGCSSFSKRFYSNNDWLCSRAAQGFESWVKNCLGSAKPEILQNVLAVLDKECFESPADLDEFGDRPAELAKLGNLADGLPFGEQGF